MNGDRRRLWIGSLCAVGCEILYGLSYIFTKQATETAGALELLGWRFLLGLLVMGACVVTGMIRIQLRGKSLRPLLKVALFSPVIYYVGETLGISRTTASESGVFLACIPVASLVASSLLLHKEPTRRQTLGILLTLAGVIVTVVAVGASSSLSVTGYAFLLLAVCSYALYSVFVDKAAEYSNSEITFMMLAAGALVFGVLALGEVAVAGTVSSLLRLPFTNGAFLMAVLYQGIGCSVFAFFLANEAIANIGVNRTSSFIGISTIVSIAAGALLLGETFSMYQLMGAVVILIGIYTANA